MEQCHLADVSWGKSCRECVMLYKWWCVVPGEKESYYIVNVVPSKRWPNMYEVIIVENDQWDLSAPIKIGVVAENDLTFEEITTWENLTPLEDPVDILKEML